MAICSSYKHHFEHVWCLVWGFLSAKLCFEFWQNLWCKRQSEANEFWLVWKVILRISVHQLILTVPIALIHQMWPVCTSVWGLLGLVWKLANLVLRPKNGKKWKNDFEKGLWTEFDDDDSNTSHTPFGVCLKWILKVFDSILWNGHFYGGKVKWWFWELMVIWVWW